MKSGDQLVRELKLKAMLKEVEDRNRAMLGLQDAAHVAEKRKRLLEWKLKGGIK